MSDVWYYCKMKNSVMSWATTGGSRTAATSKMERFVIIINGFQPLTIITKCSILDVAAVLDPPLATTITWEQEPFLLYPKHFSILNYFQGNKIG